MFPGDEKILVFPEDERILV